MDPPSQSSPRISSIALVRSNTITIGADGRSFGMDNIVSREGEDPISDAVPVSTNSQQVTGNVMDVMDVMDGNSYGDE